MKEIGGYFELELSRGKEYHTNSIRLNLGRTAFEYILRANKVQKVFLPYYTCDVMLEPIKKVGVKYEFYHINENLEPVFDFNKTLKSDFFLYTNYFGLKDCLIESLAGKVKNLIIDNSQAFFSRPISGVDTFYSPRKFFGVPDGAYLYTNIEIEPEFEQDYSFSRFSHLLGRIDYCAEEFFSYYQQNDNSFSGQPIKNMSKLTYVILDSIDYHFVAERRRSNFNYINSILEPKNRLKFCLNQDFVPMVYPFWSNNPGLRLQLISKKIYIAQYWANVLNWIGPEIAIENDLTRNMVPIPVDQRYSEAELKVILDLIKKNE